MGGRVVQCLDRRSGILDCGDMSSPLETGMWEWVPGRRTLWISTPGLLRGGGGQGSNPNAWRTIARIGPADRRRLWRAVRLHLGGASEMFEADLALRNADGSTRWLHVCGRAIGVRIGGRPQAFAGTVQSIGPARATVKDSSALLLARAAAAVGMSAWELDVGTRQFQSCARLGELFGVAADAVFTSDSLLGLIQPQDAGGVTERLQEVIANPGQDMFISEFRVALDSGRERCLKAFGAVTARGTDGRAERMCGVTFDISHRRLVDQREQETQDRILKLSRLSAMGFLASTITHEINQPLTALINNLAACEIAMRRRDMADLVAELMEANKRLVFRISEIIRRTRSFVTSGEIVRVRGSLVQAVRGTVGKLLLLPGNADLRVTCTLDPHADAVDADMVQLEHVLYNILRNAAEATENMRERLIQVDVAAEGEEVEIHVIDNGRGIDGGDYEKLFEPLWTSKDTGTGLGLAVCRTVIEAHGGTINAGPARAGRGLDIHIVLPIRAPEAPGYRDSGVAILAGG